MNRCSPMFSHSANAEHVNSAIGPQLISHIFLHQIKYFLSMDLPLEGVYSSEDLAIPNGKAKRVQPSPAATVGMPLGGRNRDWVKTRLALA